MYQHKKVTAGNVIENYKCHTQKYPVPPKGVKIITPRAAKTEATSEDQKKVNENKAYDDLRYLLLCNFVADDYWTTLTYAKAPTPKESKKILANFIKRLKYFFKKQGEILKYIFVTEYEKNERIHHHIMINKIEKLGVKIIKKIWGQGNVDYRPYRGEVEDADGISNYFIKEEHSAFYKDEKIFKTRYTPSRNLKKPEIEKQIVSAATFSKAPRAPEGYYLEKATTREGVTKWGYPYIFYRFIKLEEVNTNEKLGNKHKEKKNKRHHTTKKGTKKATNAAKPSQNKAVTETVRDRKQVRT